MQQIPHHHLLHVPQHNVHLFYHSFMIQSAGLLGFILSTLIEMSVEDPILVRLKRSLTGDSNSKN
jgi:hypothetical protein